MPHSGPFAYSRIGQFNVAEQNDILLAFQKRLVPETARPTPSPEDSEHRLEVSVVFTSAPGTIAALRKAGALAENLSARITLVVPQVVPYPCPLESPPVLIDFSERRFRQIGEESPVETTVRIYLCRDPLTTLKSVLAPNSLVVIGGPKRWWPTRERALARQLRRAGHEVVFTETGVGMNA